MFAGGGAQRKQPLLGGFQRARVGLGLHGQAAEQGFGFRKGFLGAFDGGHRLGGGVFTTRRGCHPPQSPRGGA